MYCSSSASVHDDYHRLATDLGSALGASGRDVVYGGGKLGLMGAVSGACRAAGGRTFGVITERLRDAEQLDEASDEMTVVPTMRERKRLMEQRADAFVICRAVWERWRSSSRSSWAGCWASTTSRSRS